MSSEQLYYLMHKGDIVTVVSVDEITGDIRNIGEQVQKELLPPGGNLSPDDLRRWWKRRAVPMNQGSMKKILMKHNIPTPQNYLYWNLGLSLSDHSSF